MKEEKRGFHLVMDMTWSSGAPMPLGSGATASRDPLFQSTNVGTLARWYVGTLVRQLGHGSGEVSSVVPGLSTQLLHLFTVLNKQLLPP